MTARTLSTSAGRLLIAGLLVLLWACADEGLTSTDWPQFQGPNRDGISQETGVARAWPEGGPRVLWSVPLGEGYAGPAVRDGRVYLLDRVGDNKDVLRCLELKNGRDLWKVECDAPGKTAYNGSRMTVTVTEDHVYGVGLMGDCYCFDVQTHALVWRRALREDFNICYSGRDCEYGMAQAPLIHGDLLLIGLQCGEASVAALDRWTGETVWAAEKLGFHDHTMPVVATLDGVTQVIMASGEEGQYTRKAPGAVAGLSLEDGRTLWRDNRLWQCYMPVPPPLVLSDDRLLFTGGYGAGFVMLQVKRDGDGFTVSKLFTVDTCGSQLQIPLLHDGHVYANSRENKRCDGMVCVSLDGRLMWRTKDTKGLPRFGGGPLLLAGGLILSLDGMTGRLHLIDPSPEGYRELASAKVLSGKRLWAPMAISHGKLLLRGPRIMKCLDVRNP